MKRMVRMANFCFAVVLCFCAVSAARASDDGGDPVSTYDRAVAAYYGGQLESAAQTFSGLVDGEGENGYLHYDLGNTYFKLGKLGLAILHYEKARLYVPRFEDLRTNLAKARKKQNLPTEESFSDYLRHTFYFWGDFLNLREFQTGFAAVALMFWSGVAWILLRRRSLLARTPLLAACVFAYVAGGVFLKYDAEKPGEYGVVLSPNVEARASYLEKDKAIFLLGEGTRVRVIDAQDFGAGGSWLRVALPQGQKGWVPAADLGII